LLSLTIGLYTLKDGLYEIKWEISVVDSSHVDLGLTFTLSGHILTAVEISVNGVFNERV
jgi:hypothetical protein